MLIIIEGPDCARKTTLAQMIMDQLKVRMPSHDVSYMHAGPPPPFSHPFKEYVEPFMGYEPGSDRHRIVDRWHWGERVYPFIFNRPTNMTMANFEWIEKYFYWLGAVCVLLDPPLEELQQCLKNRGDDLVKEHMLENIKFRFQLVASTSIISPGLIVPTPDNIIANAIGAERKANERNVPLWWKSRPPTANLHIPE